MRCRTQTEDLTLMPKSMERSEEEEGGSLRTTKETKLYQRSASLAVETLVELWPEDSPTPATK